MHCLVVKRPDRFIQKVLPYKALRLVKYSMLSAIKKILCYFDTEQRRKAMALVEELSDDSEVWQILQRYNIYSKKA